MLGANWVMVIGIGGDRARAEVAAGARIGGA